MREMNKPYRVLIMPKDITNGTVADMEEVARFNSKRQAHSKVMEYIDKGIQAIMRDANYQARVDLFKPRW